MSRLREERDVRAPSVEGLRPKINGLSVENNGDVRLLGRKATFTLGKRAASGHHRRRQPALHPRLPSTCIPLPIMWAAVEETGVGALGALAVGAVVVPAMEETGALPRTPSRPYGRSCLRHDRSSSNLPVAPLWSARLCPQPPLHLYACEECRGVDVWEVGHAVSPRVRPACHHAQRSQRDGRAPAKLVHRSGDRVFRPTSSKYQANRSQIP
jgi:hypothetical protein